MVAPVLGESESPAPVEPPEPPPPMAPPTPTDIDEQEQAIAGTYCFYEKQHRCMGVEIIIVALEDVMKFFQNNGLK